MGIPPSQTYQWVKSDTSSVVGQGYIPQIANCGTAYSVWRMAHKNGGRISDHHQQGITVL
ncbi:hypothetical protein [Vibrio spartinae]|uniref:hypothetical protein n=1 Tax=Vibrio spartinae TaxID=1918945 RepID=UPI0015F7F9AC|nr:hypothetical protein [Vibrio spartinae]